MDRRRNRLHAVDRADEHDVTATSSPHVFSDTADGEKRALSIDVLHFVPSDFIHLVHGVMNLRLCRNGSDANSCTLNECIELAPLGSHLINQSLQVVDRKNVQYQGLGAWKFCGQLLRGLLRGMIRERHFSAGTVQASAHGSSQRASAPKD